MGPSVNNLVPAIHDGSLKKSLGLYPIWFRFYELLENSGFEG
jgi:hypothetical protein